MSTASVRHAYLKAMQIVVWLPRDGNSAEKVLADAPINASTPASLSLGSAKRRQQYLAAMQVERWTLRVPLPFAPATPIRTIEVQAEVPAPDVAAPVLADDEGEQQVEFPTPPRLAPFKQTIAEAVAVPTMRAVRVAIPRFALQFFKSADCLQVVALTQSKAIHRQTVAYELLCKLLQAWRDLPAPERLADPIRWPLPGLREADNLADSAQDYVQQIVRTQQTEAQCSELWLVGQAAWRFAGGVELASEQCGQHLTTLGSALLVPGLDELISNRQLKGRLWQAMCELQKGISRNE